MHTIELGQIYDFNAPELKTIFTWLPNASHRALTASINPVSTHPENGKVMKYQLLIHIDCLKHTSKHPTQRPSCRETGGSGFPHEQRCRFI